MSRLVIKLSAIVLLFATLSCKKTNGGEDNSPVTPSPDYTESPPAAPVSSRLVVYTVANNQASNPYYIDFNTTSLTYNGSYKAFRSTGNFVMDKYATVLSIRQAIDGYIPAKTFTVSGALKNYVNVKVLPLTLAGYLTFRFSSATMPLPGNGQLVLPPYSFGENVGTSSFEVNTSFSAPFLNDYAVTMPCYPMADENGKRWFLDSYGVYLLVPESNDNLRHTIDFNPMVDVLLRMPVPANEQSPPDSIAVWNLNNNKVWQRNGFAIRVGNYYQKKITKKGYWNFAKPVNGVYTTFGLHTSNGFGLPNIRYTIKSGTSEVAEGRTDANGNATVFVPANKELTIDVINDNPESNIKLLNRAFGNFSKASNTTVKLPARKDIFTLQGNVMDCDGKPLSSGYVGLITKSTNDEFYFPITNGKFLAAQWIGGFGYIPTTVKIYNANGDSIASHPYVVSSPRGSIHHYKANFYSCSSTTQLFCNYKLDSTEYSITGNVNAASPELYAKSANGKTRINLMQSGKGIRFNSNDGISVPGYNLDRFGLEVNDVPVDMDFLTGSGENYLYIYKDSNVSGGFKEGWFWIYYNDKVGTTHTITGNFRVKVL